MTLWSVGLPAAETAIKCGGESHRLRWEGGALRALDHEDPAGERTLAALGAERCACVDVLDAWSRRAGDPRVLVLASRGPMDPLRAYEDLGAPAGGGWAGYAPFAIPAHRSGRGGSIDSDEELVMLATLGGGIADRLAATVAAACAARLKQPSEVSSSERAVMNAAVYGRVLAALRGWLGDPALELDLTLVEPGRPPVLARGENRLRAELPFAWLRDVWARGLTTVWGRFCIAAMTGDGRRTTLTTVDPQFGRPENIAIELAS